MARETWQFVRSVQVRDAAGEPRTVRVYRTVSEIPAGVQDPLEVAGRTRAVLDDGTPLRDIGGGRYKALATGSVLTAIAPEAP